MTLDTPRQWAKLYYYEAVGATPISDSEVDDCFDLEDYLNLFLIPAACITTSLPRDDIDWVKINPQYESTLSYLRGMPKYMNYTRMSTILNDVYGTLDWLFMLPAIYQSIDFSSNNREAALRDAATRIVSVYTKRLVSYGPECRDVYVFIHNITRTPVNTRPTDFVMYRENINAKAGDYTLGSLMTSPPSLLDDEDRRILAEAVNKQLIYVSDLCSEAFEVILGNELVSKSVTALSTELPPSSVIKLLNIMPDTLIKECGNRYRALNRYVHMDNVSIPQSVTDYMATMSSYFGVQDTAFKCVEDCTDSELLAEVAKRFGAAAREYASGKVPSISDFSLDEALDYAASKLKISVQSLREAGKEKVLTEEEVLSAIAEMTDITPESLSHLTIKKPVTDGELLTMLNSRLSENFSSLGEISRKQPSPTDTELLHLINTRLTENFSSLGDISSKNKPVTDEELLHMLNNRLSENFSSLGEVSKKQGTAPTMIIDHVRKILAGPHDSDAKIAIYRMLDIAVLFMAFKPETRGVPESYRVKYRTIDSARTDDLRVVAAAADVYFKGK